MRSLKPLNAAVEDNKKHNRKEAEANNADNFQQAVFLPNTDQRILSANVLKLQRMIGNKAVQRVLLSRMTNVTMVQRESKKITNSDERVEIGTNNDGILTVILTDAEAINSKITDIAVVDSGSNKIDIKAKHTQVENDGKRVIITVNLNKVKMDEKAKKSAVALTFKTNSGGSNNTGGQQQEDARSNRGSSEEVPSVKTQDDFITEQDYRDYLIKEILARGVKKEKDGIWKTQPYNFKKNLLQPLSTSDLVDLLTITTESSDYKKAQNFVANPTGSE